MQAILALEDGRIFRGKGYGAKAECYGEVVFNTSITGYQEIFTDPSYAGQIVVLTNPEIGNYGTNPEDNEALARAHGSRRSKGRAGALPRGRLRLRHQAQHFAETCERRLQGHRGSGGDDSGRRAHAES